MTVQETNIERVLHDHLWNEVRLLRAKIEDLTKQRSELEEREQMLRNIAKAANMQEEA